MHAEAHADGLQDPALKRRLQALQHRGRRWLNGFFALAFGTWAWGLCVVFA